MSSVRAEVYLQGIDELELFVEFEKKLRELQQIKYPCASNSLGSAQQANLAALNAVAASKP